MSAEPDPGGPPVRGERGEGGRYSVDARGAMGVQVGEGGTQINYYYSERTWADGVAAPPLADVSGEIDSPYRGLSAFEERDAAFFFGREAAAAQVLERISRQLDGTGLLVVSGVSGAGKSSLLRAGVLPRIRGGGLASAPESASWPCLLFTPARAPLDELAVRVARLAGADAATVRRELAADPAGFALIARQAALGQPDGFREDREGRKAGRRRLLLIVDQFEQLFTQCPEEAQRQAFITALHAAATAGHGPVEAQAALVVLGIRADFEARCADYPQLAAAVQDRYLVTAMTARQLRMSITEPAKKAGSRVDDDLAEVLLREMGSRDWAVSGAGVLPLLSHALDQAWRSRTGAVLGLADYERTGGIEGALADSAQRIYDGLTPLQQVAARQVFTRLTATSSDGVDTADRAARAELTEGKTADEAKDVEAVLEAFAAERLLILAAGTVEISHEILLTAWPLLRDTWLTESHTDRIVRTRLRNAAAEWSASRDPSFLYSGSLLQAAAETAARIGIDPTRHPPLSRSEHEFLRASGRAHRRNVRRRQGFTAFLVALVIGFASVAVYAFHIRQDALRQRDIAAAGQLISQSEALGDTNPVISKLESVTAWRIYRSNDARYGMLAAAANPGIAVLSGSSGLITSVTFSPDGKILASSDSGGTIRLWNVASRQPIGHPLSGTTGRVNSVAFSPDGKTLASANEDGTIRLWNVATHQRVGLPISDPTGDVYSVVFSPDGKILGGSSNDGSIRLWDVATHHLISDFLTGPSSQVASLAFSPDGKTLAGGNGSIRLWGVATHHPVGRPLTGGTGDALSVEFSPDGKTLASGNVDGTIRLWDVATQHQIGNLATGGSGGWIAFSRDGKTLASNSTNDTIRLWDVATRRPIGSSLTGHTGPVSSATFSPDGKTLASGSGDGTLRLWNVALQRPIGSLVGHTGDGDLIAFSPDGKTLASSNDAGTVRLWDVAARRPDGSSLAGTSRVLADLAFSPDGKTLVIDDGAVHSWEIATRRLIGKPFIYRAGLVIGRALSPDGRILASGNENGTIRLWNIATGRQIGNPLTGRDGQDLLLIFSPDGKTLASGNENGTIRLWGIATSRPIGNPLTGRTGDGVTFAFSPDGKTLASGNRDGTVRLWDVATGRPISNRLTGDTNVVTSLAFSVDGKTLASGDDDGIIRLWDVGTRRQFGGPLTSPPSAVTSLAFSVDGRTLASSIDDGIIRLWDVAYTTEIAPRLCAAVGRPLTRAEWAHDVPAIPQYQSVCP